MRRLKRALCATTLAVLAACGSASPGNSPSSPSISAAPETPSPEPSVSLSLSPAPILDPDQPVPVAAPGLLKVGPSGAGLAGAPGGPANTRLRAGVLVPVTAIENGWANITTPCSLSRWMPVDEGVGLAKPEVVLDPGHGGGEPGAVGQGGLQEKVVNMDVANKTKAALAVAGVPAHLTRTEDFRATIGFRVAVANAVKPVVLVSIHHNADPDGPLPKPGTETFYQFRSADSKRLSGIVYEEVVKDLSPLGAQWVGDTDAGAKWRLNSRGGDYYGILRQSGEAGVIAILAELAFLSNPSEEALLGREDVRAIESEALARAIVRYRSTNDPGSGFTTPYERRTPAGPGGGTAGCVDPA